MEGFKKNPLNLWSWSYLAGERGKIYVVTYIEVKK